jgi:hypothetical protein
MTTSTTTTSRGNVARGLDEMKRRQTGISDRAKEILDGVFELERSPDAATRRRLARQCGTTEQAVTAWFRSRRAKRKRMYMRKTLLIVLLVVGAAAGAFYAWNAWNQTAAARRRMEALGPAYKWMTRSGLPRPYADRMSKERYGTKKLKPEKERFITPSGRVDERMVRYTMDNPKASPLTKKPETPRQRLERIRAKAAKKAGKGNVAPVSQPSRVVSGGSS